MFGWGRSNPQNQQALRMPLAGGGMLAAPGQMRMPGIGVNGMEMLGMMNEIEVKERADIVQEVTAMLGNEINMKNRYLVMDPVGNRLFYAVERTDCCRRQMQNMRCHDCASWEVDLLYTPPNNLMQRFVTLKRPCALTCCCFRRPVAHVDDANTRQRIGSFQDPCTCCSLMFHVRDAKDNIVLNVDGGYCCTQPGFVCPLPCGPCAEVNFDIKDAKDDNTVAFLSKKVPSFCSWWLAPDVDNYKVKFLHVEAPEWKALLLALTIFMDFRYFNTPSKEGQQPRVQYGDQYQY